MNGDNNKQEFNAQTKQLNKLRNKQASTKQEEARVIEITRKKEEEKTWH